MSEDPWEEADRLAAERGGEPPSYRRFLTERVAWAIHVAGGSLSPRRDWAALDVGARAELYCRARAAISGYEARVREEPEEEARWR